MCYDDRIQSPWQFTSYIVNQYMLILPYIMIYHDTKDEQILQWTIEFPLYTTATAATTTC